MRCEPDRTVIADRARACRKRDDQRGVVDRSMNAARAGMSPIQCEQARPPSHLAGASSEVRERERKIPTLHLSGLAGALSSKRSRSTSASGGHKRVEFPTVTQARRKRRKRRVSSSRGSGPWARSAQATRPSEQEAAEDSVIRDEMHEKKDLEGHARSRTRAGRGQHRRPLVEPVVCPAASVAVDEEAKLTEKCRRVQESAPAEQHRVATPVRPCEREPV